MRGVTELDYQDDPADLEVGVFGPVNPCCGVTAYVGHDLYCERGCGE